MDIFHAWAFNNTIERLCWPQVSILTTKRSAQNTSFRDEIGYRKDIDIKLGLFFPPKLGDSNFGMHENG
jgi:hypothetical protein